MIYPGQDFSTFFRGLQAPSMDLSFRPISGTQAAQETILRKLRCPPGSFDDQTWGLDLTGYLGAALSPSDLAALQGRVAGAVEAEEYVESASVGVYLVSGNLVFDISVVLADGDSFTLAFALDSAGAVIAGSVGT